MKIDSDILKANFLKLWAMERVNIPFIVAIGLLREKWNTSSLTHKPQNELEDFRTFTKGLSQKDQYFIQSEDFALYAEIINRIAELTEKKEYKKAIIEKLLSQKFPSKNFMGDIDNLIKEFNYDVRWRFALALYVVTDYKYVPYDKKDSDAPTSTIVKQIRILSLRSKKAVQHEYLKKHVSLPSTTKTYDKKSIVSLPRDTDLLPSLLIHGDFDIADDVFGVLTIDDLSDDEMAVEDKKRLDNIKQMFRRLKKMPLYQPLTRERYKRLLQLFSQ